MKSLNKVWLNEYLIDKKYFDAILIGESLPIYSKNKLWLDFLCIKKENNKIYKIAIELDGEQHLREIKHFHKMTTFNDQNKRDMLKDEYFLKNDEYSFIRIKSQENYSVYDELFNECLIQIKKDKKYYNKY